MPRYTIICDDPCLREYDVTAGYDDEILHCPGCGGKKRREAVYRDQGVIYKGEGFTKQVVPPPAPRPQSSKDLTTEEHAEALDDFAKKHYDHDRNTRPARNDPS